MDTAPPGAPTLRAVRVVRSWVQHRNAGRAAQDCRAAGRRDVHVLLPRACWGHRRADAAALCARLRYPSRPSGDCPSCAQLARDVGAYICFGFARRSQELGAAAPRFTVCQVRAAYYVLVRLPQRSARSRALRHRRSAGSGGPRRHACCVVRQAALLPVWRLRRAGLLHVWRPCVHV